MATGDEKLYYWDYLRLDDVLSAQVPRTGSGVGAAHDEHLFIVVHQAYELWFKQILFELESVLTIMGGAVIAEKEMGTVVARLERIASIQRLLLDQIDVLETMTPLDFLDFRGVLAPASGFQSVQFRLIENKLGLDPARRSVQGPKYSSVMSTEHADALYASEAEPSLHHHVDRWLARTPFLSYEDFNFLLAYKDVLEPILREERRVIEDDPNLDSEKREKKLHDCDEATRRIRAVFAEDQWDELVREGERRLSHRAFVGALFIHLYRDEPILHLPFRLLTTLVNLDEGFTTWRHRHALLAHRMLGRRMGTGGTSGHTYLADAAVRHRIFTDLFDLPTFLIPRALLPVLPTRLATELTFRYGP